MVYTICTSVGIDETIMRAIALVLALIATPALADVAGVASVIDGDTMEVHGQRIRLHGIDAPTPIRKLLIAKSARSRADHSLS